MTRVRSAKLEDDAEVMENLQNWIDRASRGEMNVARDGDLIAQRLTANVNEMVHSRTVLRRVASPLAGLGALYVVLAALTVWTVAADILFLGASMTVPMATIVMGVLGSSFIVLLRTVTFQQHQTERGALIFTGFARPLVGGILGLGIFGFFGAGIISLPLVSDHETTTFIEFLGFPGTGPGIMAGQLSMFSFAFLTGLLEGIVLPSASRSFSRFIPQRVRRTRYDEAEYSSEEERD
ncbi:MAG: hypothetical protein ACOC5K_02250 [Chloroflexota bacterium]